MGCRLILFLAALLMATPVRAILTNGVAVTTPPTSTTVPNWDTGWPTGNVTGWDYVGTVNGASAVYLGYGWVLTAAHVNPGNFTLAGVTYNAIANSQQSIVNSSGTADLILFQISSLPALPPLPITTNAPVAFASRVTGTSVVLTGFGGGALSWGMDTVTEIGESITPSGYTYISTDFFCDEGNVIRGSSNITNNAAVGDGDSGGADFAYNSTTKKWELIGINEVTGTYSGYNPVTDDYYYGDGTFSGMVQLNVYEAQIAAIVDANPVSGPAMPLPALVVMAGMLLGVAWWSLGSNGPAPSKGKTS